MYFGDQLYHGSAYLLEANCSFMRLRSTQLLILSLLACGSMWLYMERILIPHQVENAAITGRPRGNLSDLYPRWVGSRELLLHGRSPYRPEVTRQIQEGYYGRVLDPQNPSDPKDQQAFAYPVYIAFLLSPVLKVPFDTLRPLFAVFLFLLTVASVRFWLNALRWELNLPALLATSAFVVGCFPTVQGLKLQQLSLFVCAVVAGAVAALVNQRPVLAGFLLALATIKPQLIALFLIWLFLWTVYDIRKRYRWIAGFFPTLIALTAASEYFLPGWLPQFLEALRQYQRYTGGTSVLEVLLPRPVGLAWAGAMLIALAVLLVAWRLRFAPADSQEFYITSCFVLATTLLLMPMFAPYNQLLLIPGILWVARNAIRVVSIRPARVLCAFLVVAVAWPWVSACALDAGFFFLPKQGILSMWAVPLFTNFMVPVLVFAVLAVVTIRISHPEIGQQA